MKAVGLSNCGHGSGQLAAAESLGRSRYRCRSTLRAVEVLEESVIITVKSGISTQTGQLLVLANQKLEELGTSDSAS